MAPAEADHHRLLGVSPDATEKEIKLAYRRLAKKHHPDMNPGCKHAEDSFKQITIAYNKAIGEVKLRAVRPSGATGRTASAPRYRRRTNAGSSSEHVNFDEWNRAHYGSDDRYDYSGTRRWNVGPSERSWQEAAARRARHGSAQAASQGMGSGSRAQWRAPPRTATRKPSALIIIAAQLAAGVGIWTWVASTLVAK